LADTSREGYRAAISRVEQSYKSGKTPNSQDLEMARKMARVASDELASYARRVLNMK
jgi:hypothetical protein